MTSESTIATPPRHAAAAVATRSDVIRQWSVLLSAVLATAVSFVGSGAVVGAPVAEVADGALSSSATLVAPAEPAFAIWGVIYVGLLLLALLQVLPSRRTDPRQRRTGWWTAASLLLNALWILVIQAELIAVSLVVIAALVAVLVVAMLRLGDSSPSTRYERLVVDGTLGLYLGWVCIATVANAAATLVLAGVSPTGGAAVASAASCSPSPRGSACCSPSACAVASPRRSRWHGVWAGSRSPAAPANPSPPLSRSPRRSPRRSRCSAR